MLFTCSMVCHTTSTLICATIYPNLGEVFHSQQGMLMFSANFAPQHIHQRVTSVNFTAKPRESLMFTIKFHLPFLESTNRYLPFSLLSPSTWARHFFFIGFRWIRYAIINHHMCIQITWKRSYDLRDSVYNQATRRSVYHATYSPWSLNHCKCKNCVFAFLQIWSDIIDRLCWLSGGHLVKWSVNVRWPTVIICFAYSNIVCVGSPL